MMASSAFFSRFRTSSCSLILSPVNSPRESDMEEENSISASFVSSEIAKEIATFFQKLFYREDRIIQFIAAVKGRKLF